jgi:hypothetical protein
MMFRHLARQLCIVGLVCVALTSGCIFNPGKDKGGGGSGESYRPLTTPVAPLANLGLTYKRHDLEAIRQYRTLFDPVNYKFTFKDKSDDPRGDGYYDYNEEIASAESLFSDPDISNITLTFLSNPADTLGQDNDLVGAPAGTRKFIVNNIELHVFKGSTDYYSVGSCIFYVSPITTNGVTEYKIYQWLDQTAGGPTQSPRRDDGKQTRGFRAEATAPAGSALLQAAALADAIKN